MENAVKLYNGVEMPLVGLGTWDLNGEACVNMVDLAIRKGYRLIDTAQMYKNEAEVGEGIRKSGIDRSELFVTTKIYRITTDYPSAKLAIDESLKRLGLDYVDLLLLHEPYSYGPELYRAVEEAYAAGKARAIGISNYNEKWYTEFLGQCSVVPMVNQLETHVYFQKWDFQRMMLEKGTVQQAWSPLASGVMPVWDNEVLREIGTAHGKSAAQIALRFLVQRGISLIPKTKRPERLDENLDLFSFALTEDEMSRIRALDQNRTLFPWTEKF